MKKIVDVKTYAKLSGTSNRAIQYRIKNGQIKAIAKKIESIKYFIDITKYPPSRLRKIGGGSKKK